MPPFCIGADGEGAGDFGGPTGRLTIDGSLAKDLPNHALAHGFDPAFSYGMRLDHGFLQPLSLLFGAPFSVPLLPIYINSVDRQSTRLNSNHYCAPRLPLSA